jgi:NADPH-dependent 7-cyano-7-deazaguanine reductase QueF
MSDADAARDGTETRYYTSTVAPLTVVEAETGGTITHEATGVEAECPYETFHDVYDVRIEYRPGAHALEIASLRAYFDQFAGVEISHEALCETVFSDLRRALDPAHLTVRLQCNEYHGIVTTVERSTE